MPDSFQRPATTYIKHAAALLVIFFSILNTRAQSVEGVDAGYRRMQPAVESIREGRLSQVETLLDSVLKSSPRDSDALNLLGVVRVEQHRASEAESLFRRATSTGR